MTSLSNCPRLAAFALSTLTAAFASTALAAPNDGSEPIPELAPSVATRSPRLSSRALTWTQGARAPITTAPTREATTGVTSKTRAPRGSAPASHVFEPSESAPASASHVAPQRVWSSRAAAGSARVTRPEPLMRGQNRAFASAAPHFVAATAVDRHAPTAAAPPATAANSPRAMPPAARMAANIDQAISFRHRGHDIPESMLPTNHPPVTGNKAELLVDGPQVFPRILHDLANATDSIHITHFAIGNDSLGKEVGKVLMDKARAGVEVRVLMDPTGSGDLLRVGSTEKMLKQWEKAGVQVIRNFHIDPMRPAEPLNHIEHRKLYVIDGKVSYTGGMGIQEKYRSEWHDVMMRVEGQATHQMQVDFLKSWQHLGGRIDQKGGTDDELKARYFPEVGSPGDVTLQAAVQIPGESPRIRDTYLREIEAAQKSLYVENPYLTDRRILNAIEAAAERGVDVHVVLPGKSDMPVTRWESRSQYDRLVRAGVHIYEFNGMTHAKVAVRDGQWATIGSSNLDSLSMNHDYEFNYTTTSPKLAATIQNMVRNDMTRSKQMQAGDVNIAVKWIGKVLLHNPLVAYFL